MECKAYYFEVCTLVSLEEATVYMPAADEEGKFLMILEDVRPTHVEMQGMMESSLHVFEKTTMNCHMEAMIETKVVCLLEYVDHEAAKDDRAPIYQAFEMSYAESSLEVPSMWLYI